eukprot:m.27609 g.27609  ORF g.27609 m.27609 type:complete len:114 (+) comp4428_c0_seq1:1270-1611(+)
MARRVTLSSEWEDTARRKGHGDVWQCMHACTDGQQCGDSSTAIAAPVQCAHSDARLSDSSGPTMSGKVAVCVYNVRQALTVTHCYTGYRTVDGLCNSQIEFDRVPPVLTLQWY